MIGLKIMPLGVKFLPLPGCRRKVKEKKQKPSPLINCDAPNCITWVKE